MSWKSLRQDETIKKRPRTPPGAHQHQMVRDQKRKPLRRPKGTANEVEENGETVIPEAKCAMCLLHKSSQSCPMLPTIHKSFKTKN